MESTHSHYLKHLYVCINRRNDGTACCADRGGEQIKAKLKAYVTANGLDGKVRVSGSGCMDLCEQGANVMVYPDSTWYHHVTLEDVERIIAEQMTPLVGKNGGVDGASEPVEAFLFDLGNVLIRFDHMILARKVTSPANSNPELLYQLFYDSPLVRQHDEGRISSRAFYDGLKQIVDLSVGYEEFVNVWNGIFSENAEMIGLLEKLLKRYPCVLVSNTNRAHFEFCAENYPVLRKMTGWALSYEIGALKPHPAIYKRALELANVPASRAFYIDDRRDLIAAADALGLQTHQFTGDISPLLDQLKKLRVEV